MRNHIRHHKGKYDLKSPSSGTDGRVISGGKDVNGGPWQRGDQRKEHMQKLNFCQLTMLHVIMGSKTLTIGWFGLGSRVRGRQRRYAV